jgi:hypothetical protein
MSGEGNPNNRHLPGLLYIFGPNVDSYRDRLANAIPWASVEQSAPTLDDLDIPLVDHDSLAATLPQPTVTKLQALSGRGAAAWNRILPPLPEETLHVNEMTITRGPFKDFPERTVVLHRESNLGGLLVIVGAVTLDIESAAPVLNSHAEGQTTSRGLRDAAVANWGPIMALPPEIRAQSTYSIIEAAAGFAAQLGMLNPSGPGIALAVAGLVVQFALRLGTSLISPPPPAFDEKQLAQMLKVVSAALEIRMVEEGVSYASQVIHRLSAAQSWLENNPRAETDDSSEARNQATQIDTWTGKALSGHELDQTVNGLMEFILQPLAQYKDGTGAIDVASVKWSVSLAENLWAFPAYLLTAGIQLRVLTTRMKLFMGQTNCGYGGSPEAKKSYVDCVGELRSLYDLRIPEATNVVNVCGSYLQWRLAQVGGVYQTSNGSSTSGGVTCLYKSYRVDDVVALSNPVVRREYEVRVYCCDTNASDEQPAHDAANKDRADYLANMKQQWRTICGLDADGQPVGDTIGLWRSGRRIAAEVLVAGEMNPPATAPWFDSQRWAQKVPFGIWKEGYAVRYSVTFTGPLGESPAGPWSDFIEGSPWALPTLINVPIGGSQITGRRIYRQFRGGRPHFVGTIGNNKETTFGDNSY